MSEGEAKRQKNDRAQGCKLTPGKATTPGVDASSGLEKRKRKAKCWVHVFLLRLELQCCYQYVGQDPDYSSRPFSSILCQLAVISMRASLQGVCVCVCTCFSASVDQPSSGNLQEQQEDEELRDGAWSEAVRNSTQQQQQHAGVNHRRSCPPDLKVDLCVSNAAFLAKGADVLGRSGLQVHGSTCTATLRGSRIKDKRCRMRLHFRCSGAAARGKVTLTDAR